MDDTEPNEQGNFYSPYKKFIGAVVPNWLMRRTDVSHGAKLCFARLAQFAGKNDCAFPGQQTLADELAVSVASIKAYLRELYDLGIITSRRMGNGEFSVYFFINVPGVVQFRSDGEKNSRLIGTDGEDSSRQRRSDVQNSSRLVGQNSIRPNREENQNESQYENHKRIEERETRSATEIEDDEIPF